MIATESPIQDVDLAGAEVVVQGFGNVGRYSTCRAECGEASWR